MKLLGKTMDDHLAAVTRRIPETSLMDKQSVSCDADIYANQVFIEHRSALDTEFPSRPYMHIVGECRAIRGNIPCGVSELRFAEGSGIPVDIFYEFTDEELSELVLKGMYRKGFECPSVLCSTALELPIFCDFRVVMPSNENDVPIVFADIADRRSIEISEETCGYRFASYFDEVQEEEKAEPVYDFDETTTYDYSDIFEDEIQEEIENEVEDVEEQEEIEPELSEEDKAIEEHYQNIRQRISEHEGGSESVVSDTKEDAKDTESNAIEDIDADMSDDFVDFDETSDDSVKEQLHAKNENQQRRSIRRAVAVEDNVELNDEGRREIPESIYDIAERTADMDDEFDGI